MEQRAEYDAPCLLCVSLRTLTTAPDSPLVSLTGLGHTIIITNSFDSAKTILERSLASDRPQVMSMNELVGWKNSLIFSPFNDVWKRQRRHFHQVIGTRSSLMKYDAMKEVVAAKFVADLMEEPGKLEEHCHTSVIHGV